MKLIDEKEVEAEKRMFIGDQAQTCFESGVEFAEQKLLPVMVEFAEWIGKLQSSDDWFKYNRGTWFLYLHGHLTTEQLLEQFLKPERNEKTILF